MQLLYTWLCYTVCYLTICAVAVKVLFEVL